MGGCSADRGREEEGTSEGESESVCNERATGLTAKKQEEQPGENSNGEQK